MTLESEAGGFFMVTSHFITQIFGKTDNIKTGIEIEEKIMVEAIREAKKHLEKHFGKTQIPLGELQRHQRGEVDLPVMGGPDILAAAYGAKQKDGRFRIYTGDSYIELVRYSENGVEIESVNAYGASAKAGSPHYTDQMEMYTRHQLKRMVLDKEAILREAKRVYHPGE